MKRYLFEPIKKDLKDKIILLSGPRQSGKTTLAKMIPATHSYLNYDDLDDRLIFRQNAWDRNAACLILDELHKMKNWKSWLKGVYDSEGLTPPIVVTGSAKLDTYRKVGDSLAGRYFGYRLHPLDLKEIKLYLKPKSLDQELDKLLQFGGFPEPFLKNKQSFYNKWKRSHLDIILRQDLIDLEQVHQIKQIETLILLLKSRVGSPLSYKSLAEDLNVSDKTIKRWLIILENMYIIFKVTPYHKNIARSLQKQPKYYFYDTGQVDADNGIKLENTVACALLKEIHYQQDIGGPTGSLYYLQNKSKQEIDFLITKNEKPDKMIEVKWSDDQPAKSFFAYQKFLPKVKKLQLVKEIRKDKTYPDGLEIRKASQWLANFSLD